MTTIKEGGFDLDLGLDLTTYGHSVWSFIYRGVGDGRDEINHTVVDEMNE